MKTDLMPQEEANALLDQLHDVTTAKHKEIADYINKSQYHGQAYYDIAWSFMIDVVLHTVKVIAKASNQKEPIVFSALLKVIAEELGVAFQEVSIQEGELH